MTSAFTTGVAIQIVASSHSNLFILVALILYNVYVVCVEAAERGT